MTCAATTPSSMPCFPDTDSDLDAPSVSGYADLETLLCMRGWECSDLLPNTYGHVASLRFCIDMCRRWDLSTG